MQAVPHHIIKVPVLRGAIQQLCGQRELRNKYQTNRSIKTWSAYFLLKTMSPSGVLKNWLRNSKIFELLKIEEGGFRARLKEMIELELITVCPVRYNITLCSYKKAAAILDIEYTGVLKINYDTSIEGKQVFQYILRAEDIRLNQQLQLDALCYYIDKNPLLKTNLLHLLQVKGCDHERLENDQNYFQEKLLELQQQAFKEGSDIIAIIHQHRADINRGVNKIKQHHNYKSSQSVSYMKKVLQQLSLITVTKKIIESTERTRLYVPDAGDKSRDGYKWFGRKKVTAWRLTDQIKINFSSNEKAKQKKQANRAAA